MDRVIEWSRVAKPQPDGYDCEVVVAEGVKRFNTPVDYWPDRIDKHWFCGMHLVDDQRNRHDGMTIGKAWDERLVPVEDALRRWPLALRAVALVDEYTPMVAEGELGRGCMSGGWHPRERGGRIGIFSTINDAVGGAEGIVHEAAHQRLHCLGVDLERHDGMLLACPLEPEPRFFSPIRRDCLRPITALLHGIYAWTFMLEVDLAACGVDCGEEYLKINVPKVRMGVASLREHCVPAGVEGKAFLEGFYVWADDAVRRGEEALRVARVLEVPVPGLGE